MTGSEKAANFLALVGEELAGEITAELDEADILRLRIGISKISLVSKDKVETVYPHFIEDAGNSGIAFGHDSQYLKTILTRAFGGDKAQELWRRSTAGNGRKSSRPGPPRGTAPNNCSHSSISLSSP